MSATSLPSFRPALEEGWVDVSLLAYKEEPGVPFKDITRQTLFKAPELLCELRYFEMAPGGYSTLERHIHVHGVMILKGRGRCLVGDVFRDMVPHDLVYIPPLTWHQFQANQGESFGFLCMVNAERDKPELPTTEEARRLGALGACV